MRRLLGQKSKLLMLSAFLALSIMFIPVGKVFAVCPNLPDPDSNPCKPYFKVFGSDVFAGGWFTHNGLCDTVQASNYQDFQTDSTHLHGGVLAYAKTTGSNPAGGASSQYGAFALGNIEGGTSSFKGFYSQGAFGTSGTLNGLSFANDTNPPYGGAFQGSIRQSHCIPDYFSKKPAALTTPNFAGLTNNTPSDIYYAQPAASTTNLDLNGGPVNIPAGADITIYVNGSVYISNDIKYPTSLTETTVPKFTLVAEGNIYIASTVTQLDGLYIAQPGGSDVPTSNSGIIWTCHPNDQIDLQYSYLNPNLVNPNCVNKLVFNGALIAKQVNFTRTPGDVAGTFCSNEDTLEDVPGSAKTCPNIAEIINYSPAMVIGGGFFNPSTTAPLGVESLLSLPPTL